MKRKRCVENLNLYRTNLDSLYASYTGGFNMKTGVPNKKFVQQFFHKLRVEPDNTLSVNGLKRVPSAD